MLLILGCSKEANGWVKVSNFPNIIGYMGLTPERYFTANRFVCSGFGAWSSMAEVDGFTIFANDDSLGFKS